MRSGRAGIWLGCVVLGAFGCGPEPEPQLPAAELRFTAVDAADYQRFVLPIGDVTVSSGDRVLETERVVHALELAVPGHSPLVARVEVPAGLETLSFTIDFDGTGAFVTSTGSGSFETGGPLRFDALVSDLQIHNHAVVELSLSRSLVPAGDALLLLPNLNVRF